MQVIIDKLLLFAGGCILLFSLPVTVESVASMLAALTLSSLGSFLEYRRVSLLFALLFTASFSLSSASSFPFFITTCSFPRGRDGGSCACSARRSSMKVCLLSIWACWFFFC